MAENKKIIFELNTVECKTIGYEVNWIGINRELRKWLNKIVVTSQNKKVKINFKEKIINVYLGYSNWFNIHINKLTDEKIYNESWNR